MGSHETYALRRQQLVKPICDYLSENAGMPHRLILDGTGPRLTVHLPYLNGMGVNILDQFEDVHAFSGGIGAYCIYLAQRQGYLKHDFSHYFTEVDRQARVAHRQSLKQYVVLARNYLLKQPLYDSLCYMNLFRYVIQDEFLQAPLDDVAPNFIPYVALPERIRPVPVTADNGFDRSKMSVSEVMEVGMKIPRVYSDFNRHRKAFDATYTAGYWNTRLRISESLPSTVILSTNPSGVSYDACVIDILDGKNPRYQRLFDLMTLILNLPNGRYQRDLRLAYL